MTTIFTWAPDSKANGTVTLAVRSAQFGDGYKQVVADGINNKSQSWPLTFTGLIDRVTPIRDFLDARGGFQSFLWTPPLGAQGYYRCATYTMQPMGGRLYQVTATFEQAFQP
jgi:phage-related protein